MANWILIKDNNDQRRNELAKRLESVISPVDGLTVGSAVGSGWSAVWSAAGAAPVDVDTNETGGAIVWGTALTESGEGATAADVRAAWRGGAKAQWDGYYAAVVVEDEGRTVMAGADLLGIFPVYYWTGGDGITLVGSSPEMFRHHPLFSVSLDVEALVGILLTNGLVDNRALLAGVRRLGQGCRVRSSNGQPVEDTLFSIPEVDDDDMPFVAHIDKLYDTLAGAVDRHTSANATHAMLLSGGLDSRMVAGFMHRLGRSPRAMTLGLPGDLEMRCAKAVARYYNLDHTTGEPDADNYPDACRLAARWEHLASGFTNVRDWWTQGRLRGLGDRVVTGLLSDSLVGGCSVEWAYSDETADMSYANFVDQMPKLGIPDDVLRRLLRDADHQDFVATITQKLRDEFEGYGETIPYCAWRYDLAHGQRYHVGSIAWRMSFGAWPVIPMLDRRVIEVAAGMPGASMADRELQIAMIVDKFPDLAALPVDRSDRYFEEPEYLAPEARQLLASSLRRMIRPLKEVRQRLVSSENRYWFRINDFSGPQWMRARMAVEERRERVGQLFDHEILNQVLPSPGSRMPEDGPYIGESARKMLLGLLYWSDAYLNDELHG